MPQILRYYKCGTCGYKTETYGIMFKCPSCGSKDHWKQIK